MKEIKAVVKPTRIAAVLQVLKSVAERSSSKGACQHIAVSQVVHPLTPRDHGQPQYSMELAEPVLAYYRVEFVCTDDTVMPVVASIKKAAYTGQPDAGWIVVTETHAIEHIS
ncbi:P-II family nitrogen regulator [uncultured Propionivibrio sp.]|uniref:P-II family nitrogen regulator n=1 Tax=uncultured Propionivibrio sp. TaxID=426737 RepID=UPI0029BFF38F|nr:P-II family nitrogen regulator [uncultured Propionivibrio sp.]